MPESISKDALLDAITRSHAALEGLLTGLSDDQMTRDGVMEGWSLKDVLAHITWWEQWMLRVMRGEPEAMSQLAAMRSDGGQQYVDELNAATYAANRQRPLLGALAEFHTSFQQVLQQVAAMTEAELADLHRVIAANTFDHYDEHAQGIRAWLDSVGEAGSQQV